MAGDQPFPIHRHHLLDRLLCLERIKVDHAPARQCTDRNKIAAKMSFSFGNRMTIELSEWLSPTWVNSRVVPPRLRVLFLSIVSSGNGVAGSLRTAGRSFALLWAMIFAPASLKGWPPAMWS